MANPLPGLNYTTRETYWVFAAASAPKIMKLTDRKTFIVCKISPYICDQS